MKLSLTVMSSFSFSASFRSCSISPMATVVRHSHPETGSEVSKAERMLGKTLLEMNIHFIVRQSWQCNLFYCLWEELIAFYFTVIHLQLPLQTAICNSNSPQPGLQILTNRDACKISCPPPPQTFKSIMSQCSYTCSYIVQCIYALYRSTAHSFWVNLKASMGGKHLNWITITVI